MAGHTFPKIKCKLKIKFWKLVLSMSSMKYAVDKLHNRFTVSSHFVLTDKLSLTGREFCLLAHLPILMMKVKYEIKQIRTILFLYVLEFFEIFHLPEVRQWHPMFQKQIELRINISFSIDSKNFFLTCDHRKMLTLNFDSHFHQSITLSNFYPRLKVGTVLKSELSWLSEIVQNFNPGCLRSWQIPFF